jgi:hypothetical protein
VIMKIFVIGTPKSYTSSTVIYLSKKYNFEIPFNHKEGGYFLDKELIDKLSNKNIVDGTQWYLYEQNFIKNLELLDDYLLIVSYNDIVIQYEKFFSMLNNFSRYTNLRQSVLDGEDETFNSTFDHEKNQSIILNILDYEKKIKRKTTDFEILNFFLHGNSNFFQSRISQQKIQFIIDGKIDQFLLTELKQLKNNDWQHFNILPQLMISWIYNWLKEKNACANLKIITYLSSDDLKNKIDEIMYEKQIPSIAEIDFPYVSPTLNHLKQINKESSTPKKHQFKLTATLAAKLKQIERENNNYFGLNID